MQLFRGKSGNLDDARLGVRAMKCVVQRVSGARLEVAGQSVAAFEGSGLVVLAGLEEIDTLDDARWAAEKLVHLRIFPDDSGKMNRSVIDIAGAVLLVPNFTLAGDAAKGRRPSFDKAMKPDLSEPMFEHFVAHVRTLCARTHQGVFRAHMQVTFTNDGPITILLDSRDRQRST